MKPKKVKAEELSLFTAKQMRGGFSSELEEALAVLADHLKHNGGRQTPERRFILSTIYNTEELFTIDELHAMVHDKHANISKTTLYSNIKLFEQLHLVVSHRLRDNTYYERALRQEGICRQICRQCGKVQRYKSKAVTQVINNVRWPHFQKEHFTLYVYGTCRACAKKLKAQSGNHSKR